MVASFAKISPQQPSRRRKNLALKEIRHQLLAKASGMKSFRALSHFLTCEVMDCEAALFFVGLAAYHCGSDLGWRDDIFVGSGRSFASSSRNPASSVTLDFAFRVKVSGHWLGRFDNFARHWALQYLRAWVYPARCLKRFALGRRVRSDAGGEIVHLRHHHPSERCTRFLGWSESFVIGSKRQLGGVGTMAKSSILAWENQFVAGAFDGGFWGHVGSGASILNCGHEIVSKIWRASKRALMIRSPFGVSR